MNVGRRRILIVDDDAGIRTSLARILRAGDCEICVAKDGPDALATSESFQPDLLLVDMRMPGMDGVETFARLRQKFPHLAAIFMTAYASSDKNDEAFERGAMSVIAKPLDLDRLLPLVRKATKSAAVLIVDDDAASRQSIARVLQANQIDVETVTSFSQAVRSIRQRPDRVVIADVYLQDGLGYDLLAETSAVGQRPPFVLITGDVQWLDGELARGIGDQVICLGKPVDVEALISRVSQP